MGKSKKIRGGLIQGVDAITGLNISQVAKSTLDASSKTVDVVGNTSQTLNEGLKVGQEGLKLGQQGLQTTSGITKEAGLTAEESLKTLTTQINNASENATALSHLSTESIKKLTPGASLTVGNIGTLTTNITDSVNKTVSDGSKMLLSLTTLISSPFTLLKNTIDEKLKDKTPEQKFTIIKNAIKDEYKQTIQQTTFNNFVEQITNILKNIDELVKILNDTCKKGTFYGSNCDERVNKMKMNIEFKTKMLKRKEGSFKTRLTTIFSAFFPKVDSIQYSTGEDQAQTLYAAASEYQSEILNSAMIELNALIEELNKEIDEIEEKVNTLISTIMDITGGRKSRKSKKSRKSRKSKKSRKI